MRFPARDLFLIFTLLVSILGTRAAHSEESTGSLSDYASARAKVWLGCTFNNSLNRARNCEPSSWYGRAVIEGMQRCRAAVQSEACLNVVKADPILAETARVIRSLANSSGSPHLPIKYKGSEFVVLTENMPLQKLEHFVARLRSELSRDPAIRRIYDQQETYLRSSLQEAERSVATVAERAQRVRDAKASLEKFMKARESLFSVHGSRIQGVEEMSDVLDRTRGLRYPD